jgi:hypothetical protein
MIARCIGAAEVVAAVRFVRHHDLEIPPHAHANHWYARQECRSRTATGNHGAPLPGRLGSTVEIIAELNTGRLLLEPHALRQRRG